MTVIFLTSCTNSEKTEKLINPDIENKTPQSEFKKVDGYNPLGLKYQILDEKNEQIEFSKLEKMAEFPGGFESFYVFIHKKLDLAFQMFCNDFPEGKVEFKFVIDSIGNVTEIDVVKSLRKDIDRIICDKVIAKSPKWIPAELTNKNKVKIKFHLTLVFKVEE